MRRLASTELRFRAMALLSFVGAMWLVWLSYQLIPGGLGLHGIIPRSWDGVFGIITAPFIHYTFDHLLANTIPLLILGALILLGGAGELVYVVVVTALVSGLGIWLFGAPGTMHIGASGIVFGFIGYLLFRAFFDRRISSILITILVAVLYGGSLLWAMFPTHGISWSGHVFGFIGGYIAARARHPRRGLVLAALVLMAMPMTAAQQYEVGIQHVILRPANTGEIDVATSRGFAATADWFVSDRTAAHFAATFVNPETILFPATPPPSDVDLGTLGLDIYSLSARYYVSPVARWSPYLGAGGAYVVFGNLEDRFGDDIDIEFDPELAPLAEAGLRFRFRRGIFFNAGITYIPVTATSNVRRNNDTRITLPAELKLNPVIVSVGIAWHFKR
jgi:membrane associated rhomboid family serine protease/outer membrane protein W